ncbi:MAG TPA: sigma-70 family RNA polymerase sigma factor, partial [Aggregatilineales bacterium]|nr:sigma-70 family RNA polymerase sigma factor [Aggregatilineales bacterium]
PVTVLSDDERSDDTDPFDRLERQEERQRIHDALKTLPHDYQDVLVLRFMQELSYAEVALILNKSELALRSIQHRALKALGKKLDVFDKSRSYLRGKKPL